MKLSPFRFLVTSLALSLAAKEPTSNTIKRKPTKFPLVPLDLEKVPPSSNNYDRSQHDSNSIKPTQPLKPPILKDPLYFPYGANF